MMYCRLEKEKRAVGSVGNVAKFLQLTNSRGERLNALLVLSLNAKASVLMQRLSYQTETVLSNKTTRNRIVLSFKDSPRKPLGWRPLGKFVTYF